MRRIGFTTKGHEWARSHAAHAWLYHEGPRMNTKPCGGGFFREGPLRARSHAADWLYHEGPRMNTKPCGGGFSTKGTKMHEAMRRRFFREGPLRARSHAAALFTTKGTKMHEAMRRRFLPRRAAKGHEAMLRRFSRSPVVAVHCRRPSRFFVAQRAFCVRIYPQGFAALSGPSRTNTLRRKAFVSLSAPSW